MSSIAWWPDSVAGERGVGGSTPSDSRPLMPSQVCCGVFVPSDGVLPNLDHSIRAPAFTCEQPRSAESLLASRQVYRRLRRVDCFHAAIPSGGIGGPVQHRSTVGQPNAIAIASIFS